MNSWYILHVFFIFCIINYWIVYYSLYIIEKKIAMGYRLAILVFISIHSCINHDSQQSNNDDAISGDEKDLD